MLSSLRMFSALSSSSLNTVNEQFSPLRGLNKLGPLLCNRVGVFFKEFKRIQKRKRNPEE